MRDRLQGDESPTERFRTLRLPLWISTSSACLAFLHVGFGLVSFQNQSLKVESSMVSAEAIAVR